MTLFTLLEIISMLYVSSLVSASSITDEKSHTYQFELSSTSYRNLLSAHRSNIPPSAHDQAKQKCIETIKQNRYTHEQQYLYCPREFYRSNIFAKTSTFSRRECTLKTTNNDHFQYLPNCQDLVEIFKRKYPQYNVSPTSVKISKGAGSKMTMYLKNINVHGKYLTVLNASDFSRLPIKNIISYVSVTEVYKNRKIIGSVRLEMYFNIRINLLVKWLQ
eukprot:284961_1